ncbi:MAG: sulfatase family protein [Planctomycetota bacterium]|jgi:arylsulfatase A-like enzyme
MNQHGKSLHITINAIRVLLFSIILTTPILAAESPTAGDTRPNIIFLLADDMRWDAMGCAGNSIIQTPHLDRLAAQGLMFTNNFCTTSICAVNRACIRTGQYASRHRIRDFRTPLSPQAFARSYPGLLRANGYRTGFIGKWGLGGPLPQKQFDFWAGYAGQGNYLENGDPQHLTSKLRKKALEFIKTSASQQPFNLSLSFKAPHVQDRLRRFIPDPKYKNLFKNDTIPIPKTATEKAFSAKPEFIQKSMNRSRWEWRFANPQMYQNTVKDYYRLIVGIDETLGQICQLLDELKITNNTIIIFSSDNGFFLGEHGLAGKWLMYEESIRLPLIIKHPQLIKASQGQRVNYTTLSIDIAPTILDFAGIPAPKQMQGKSLKPLLNGKPVEWRKDFFYEHHFAANGTIPRNEGVRNQRFKYIRYLDPQPNYEELFDLAKDPLEVQNLATSKEHAQTLEKIRQRWQVLREKAK